MKRILIVDDEADICLLLKKFFAKNGFETDTAANGEEGIKKLKEQTFDLVICDFKLPDYNGLEILQKIKIINAKTQVIIITGYSDVRIAVEALKKGAYEYVTKPLYPEEILMIVNNALKQEAKSPNSTKPVKNSTTKATAPNQYVVGKSRHAQVVQKHIELIAPTDMSVIILGETGTGKEYVAKSIHYNSKRADEPFIAVDCGALPDELAGSELFGHIKGAFTGAINDKKGCFELAEGGTLFLDELGNLSYDNQVKLLRVLQERYVRRVGGAKDIPVDVRVLVATNENLKKAVSEGNFREDLYHRVNEFVIELSPLRERTDDIPMFAEHFLGAANEQLDKQVMGFDKGAMAMLKAHHWHGNLRELSNVVKRAVLLCQSDKVNDDCLPVELMSPEPVSSGNIDVDFNGTLPTSLRAVVEHAEKSAILEVLKKTNNNKSKTAELLDIDRKTLYNKLTLYNIDN
ncbi:sigma-54-dependent transcriptional regulator [Reichenbachiella agariperforans]|uniref:sigma-54-dependent transcriptional regulator n=1 Tax=Reichenbachiella agariperforans TaxID=156994 RepID=UPI001C09E04F|nr:sigma-54 dependent transcriptional regulator [Reichenbachiella agariperforans]MBU2913240.1 sigma-54 dependent transcriptional regulator [Reichenbachiella agariperforans]